MSWLDQHASLISALASVGMLLLWSTYAWLFYQEFRQRRALLLFIHSAGGGELRSACMLVNLSSAPVHVACSMAARDGSSARLRDLSDNSLPIASRAKQGPLGAGESLCLGTFEEIVGQLDRVARNEQRVQMIEIRVAAIHSSHPAPVGACRRFRLDREASQINADMLETTQMQSRSEVRQVRRWLEDCRDQP